MRSAKGQRRGRGWLRWLSAVAAVCLVGLAASAPATADTVTVTTPSDSGPESLRAAIADADAGDTIAFDESLDGETIGLDSAIAIDKSLTIAGPGAAELTIDAGHDSRIFEVTAGDLSISGLTLANGATPSDGTPPTNGGAIDYTGAGSLTVSDCVFTGNRAGGDGGSGDLEGWGWGGAIAVSHAATSLTVADCAFTGNSAGGDGGSGDFSGRGRGGAVDYRGAGPLTISDSAFTANVAGGAGGASIQSGLGRGGAINVSEPAASVSISDSDFTANTAGGNGGGGGLSGRGEGGAIRIVDDVPLTVDGSTFADNVAGGAAGVGPGSGAANGGAIYSFGALTVSTSSFDGNAAGGQAAGGSNGAFGFGGAIYSFSNLGVLTVFDSTFAHNTAGGMGGNGNGGAIRVSSVLSRSLLVSNSTLFANAAGGGGGAGWGGAIDVDGAVAATLASVTIDANAVGAGGGAAGIHRTTDPGSGTRVIARATIVSANTGAPNCNTPAFSSSYSLEGPSASDTSCGFALPSADPQLGPLQGNGGPTDTQALAPSSPAIDAVPRLACPTSADQRGEPRPEPMAGFCDVGAFERQDPQAPPSVTIAMPADGATYELGQVVSTSFACPEGVGGPGIASCTDQFGRRSGAALDTATLGGHTLTVTAISQNGLMASASIGYRVVPKPDPPPPTGPQPPPKQPLRLSLEVEGTSLRQLLRTGKLAVTATVNEAARVTLGGRAKRKARTSRKPRTKLVRVFKRKMARFTEAGEKTVRLALTRKGRGRLRGLRKATLVIAGGATGAGGETRTLVALTLRR